MMYVDSMMYVGCVYVYAHVSVCASVVCVCVQYDVQCSMYIVCMDQCVM